MILFSLREHIMKPLGLPMSLANINNGLVLCQKYNFEVLP